MARRLPTRGDIVATLSDAGRAVHARELATRCGVSPGAYPKFLELLERLSLDGTIRRLSGSRFQAQRGITKDTPTWVGALTVHPRGFGFVAAAGHDDVYVAPDGIAGALHGDMVEVMLIGRSSRGSEGRIVSVVKRRNPRVAGVLRKRRKSAWLEPDDTRVRGPIVLDAVPKDVGDGDAAVVEITTFPETSDENPAGKLIAVLGSPGDPNAEVAKILIREQIVEAHPEAAMQEAETMAAKLGRLPTEARRDLRTVPLLTIDPEDARDHDDAVYAERVGGGYRVTVAIADVSEYVQPGSALDQEAIARGVTIYLPDRAIPMLPAALAADLCSLLPDRERLCLAVIADLDRQGKVKRYEVVEGVMRGAAMIAYSGVARALAFSETAPASAQAERFKRELKVLDEVARKLRRARIQRGSLDFDLPEPKISLDDQTGAPLGVVRRAGDPGVKRAYQIVEELMILANELVAAWLLKKRCPAIYRVHGKPDEQKLERLGEVCEKLGAPFDMEEMLEVKGVSKWLTRITQHPKRGVLESLLLRSMKQAVYDITNIGHFGLASEAYLHFTSPIRRYPDIVVHRAVKHLVRGGKVDTSPSAVEQMRTSATISSTRERAAMEIEREVVDLYRALYMRDHIGETFEGTVNAVVGSGLYVTLDDPFVDVLVRYESMGPDHYQMSDDELGAVGLRSGDSIALGDRILVTIEDVALMRRAVFGKRVVPKKLLDALEREPRGKRRDTRGRSGAPQRTEPGRHRRDREHSGSRRGGKGGKRRR